MSGQIVESETVKPSQVYKVVRVIRYGKEKCLYSAMMTRGNWRVRYEVRRPVTGYDGTPVMAFKDLDSAQAFRRDCCFYSSAIYVAEADVIGPVCRACYCSNVRLQAKSFWNAYLNSEPLWSYMDFTLKTPTGTLACRSVTLLEKVSNV